MANDVELRITGEDDSTQATSSAADGIRSVSDEARKATSTIGGLDTATRKAGDGASETAGKLDRMGSAGGNAESQFLGLGAGISGATTLMQGGKLSAEDMAMGLADIGDSIEHTVVPWAGKAKDALGNMFANFKEGGIKQMTSEMGGMGKAALGVGAALGIAGIAFGIREIGEARKRANIEKLIEDFRRTKDATVLLSMAMDDGLMAQGRFLETFDKMVEDAPELAQQFIEQAEAAGMDEERLRELNKQLAETTDLNDQAAQSIKNLNDELQAMTDPIFAAFDAQNSLNEAQAAYNDAVKEHGVNSAEAEAATIALTQASADYDSALLSLEESVKSGDTSMGQFEATLARWTREGRITSSQADTVRRRLRGVEGAARDIPGSVRTTVSAVTADAMERLRQVGLRIRQLDGSVINVRVNARATSTGRIGGVPIFGHGGIRGAATGGSQSGGPTLVGEFGPEIVDMAAGSKVTTAGDTKRRLAREAGEMLGGAPTVNLYVQGSILSERDLVQLMRDEFDRGSFRGVLTR